MTRPGKKISILLSFFVFFLISLGIMGMFYVKNLEITRVKIEGNLQLSEESLLKITGLELPRNYLDIKTAELRATLEEHPLIYRAKVSKTFKGALRILLSRSNPVVTVLSENEGDTLPLYFDRTGTCIQVGVQRGVIDVPVLSGVLVKNPVLGMQLPHWIQSFLQQIDIIKHDNPALIAKISEFRLRTLGNYTMIEVYFNDTYQYVSTDPALDEELLSKMYSFIKNAEKNEKLRKFNSFEITHGVVIGRVDSEQHR